MDQKRSLWIKRQIYQAKFDTLTHLAIYETVVKYFNNIYDGIVESWMIELQKKFNLHFPDTPTEEYFTQLKLNQKDLECKWKNERDKTFERTLNAKNTEQFISNLIDNGELEISPMKTYEDIRKIPSSVKISVWRRDQGCCVQCGSKEKIEYDHIIPFSKGGSNTERNIQLLCEKCNRSKSAKII